MAIHVAPDVHVLADGGVAVAVRPTVDGGASRVDEVRALRVVVLFWRPSSGYCRQLRRDLERWAAARPAGGPLLAVVSQGPAGADHALAVDAPAIADPRGEIARSYGVTQTPAALILDGFGETVSRPVACAASILHLLHPALYPWPPPAVCDPRV
jgi:hypothetical protein